MKNAPSRTISPPVVNTSGQVQDFIAKWRGRWPEWAIAEMFIPAAQRQLSAAWLALLHELTAAAWALEPAPGLAKLGWWQDELIGWARGVRRHPLGEVLLPQSQSQSQSLPWREMASALNGLSVSRDSIPESALAAVDLQPLVRVVAVCEAILFAAKPSATDSVHYSIALDFLSEQTLLRGDVEAAARFLVGRPPVSMTALPRRLLSAILSGRLQQLRRGTPTRLLPAWRSLINAWRAARGFDTSHGCQL